MGKIIEVVNPGTTARSIEFLNDFGTHDSCTVYSGSRVAIAEDSLITKKEDIIKRGLRIIEPPTVVTNTHQQGKKVQQPDITTPSIEATT